MRNLHALAAAALLALSATALASRPETRGPIAQGPVRARTGVSEGAGVYQGSVYRPGEAQPRLSAGTLARWAAHVDAHGFRGEFREGAKLTPESPFNAREAMTHATLQYLLGLRDSSVSRETLLDTARQVQPLVKNAAKASQMSALIAALAAK